MAALTRVVNNSVVVITIDLMVSSFELCTHHGVKWQEDELKEGSSVTQNTTADVINKFKSRVAVIH